jgi:hypothetical protein
LVDNAPLNGQPHAANRRKDKIKKIYWHKVNWKRRKEIVYTKKRKKTTNNNNEPPIKKT